MYSIHSILHPAVYHGQHQRAPFFEGWYYRLISADETTRLAIIPGVFLGKNGHAFIQVLDGVTAHTEYYSFPLKDFTAAKKTFEINIGQNTFSLAGFHLDLKSPQGRVSGKITIHNPQPWPVTLTMPGIMGWYAWVPAMECYHGVLSFDHLLSGGLTINGQLVDFSGGRGYIEKDWGSAFPEGYVWMQTNHFDDPGICLTASIASIPWIRTAFLGFIVGLWINGTLYRFATYTKSSLVELEISDAEVGWIMQDDIHRLEIHATRAEAGFLKGPTTLEMGKRIPETMNAQVTVSLFKRNGDKVYEGTGRHAGMEVFQSERLLAMVR
jgi:tocopherol cyclase